jgi:hypothetical protein
MKSQYELYDNCNACHINRVKFVKKPGMFYYI